MIKPLFNNILIKPHEKEVKTAGGIFIPETATERPQLGTIEAIGDTKVVKVGQKVFYPKWAGNEVKLDNKTYLLMQDKDLLGIEL